MTREESLENLFKSVCAFQGYDRVDHNKVVAGLIALRVIDEINAKHSNRLEYARAVYIEHVKSYQKDCAIRSAYTRMLLLDLLEVQKGN